MKHPSLALIPALLLLGAGCTLFSSTETNVNVSTGGSGTSLGMWAEANGIVVSDQKPGSSVTLSAVLMAEDGWVVVHEGEGGKPGAIIGESYLEAGEHASVTIALRKAIVDGRGYVVMIHRDDGDRRFNAAADTAVSSTLGGAIMSTFEASAEAGDLPIILP